jgi:hypothetical protein
MSPARFTGNPHIVAATRRDYTLQTPHTTSTFPEPLPPYLPRNTKLSTTVTPVRDPNTANAGRFSLSLKGMRRELRKSGSRAEVLVRDVEYEILEWLQAGGTVLAPDAENTHAQDFDFEGTLVRETGTVFEVSRTPLQLVWSITDDSFARYVVHCCARYHEIVSFSQSCIQFLCLIHTHDPPCKVKMYRDVALLTCFDPMSPVLTIVPQLRWTRHL